MRASGYLVIALYFGGVLLALSLICPIPRSQGAADTPKPTLAEAFRKFDKGLTSENKEERVNALRSMLPGKKDIAYLFPKHVDKLWPKFEENNRFLVENVDRFAKQITRGGAITKIDAIDVRADKDRASGSHKELLAIIPKEVHVFELIVDRAKSSSGSGTYLYLKDHWFWIKDLEALPAVLDKLK